MFFADFCEVAQFSISRRGTPVLINKGFRFIRDGQFIDSTNWRCAYYFRLRCKARAITTKANDGRVLVKITNPNHTVFCARNKKD